MRKHSAPVALFLLAFRSLRWLSAHGCPCSCLPSPDLALIPRLSLLLLAFHSHKIGSLPTAGSAPACCPSPAAALCPWLPLHGRVMRLLSALPCPRWGKGCEMRCTTCYGVSVVLLSCACCCALMVLVSCYCRVPVVVCLLLLCACCCCAPVVVVRLLLSCACCCCAPVVVVCLSCACWLCADGVVVVCLLVVSCCCRAPVVVMRLLLSCACWCRAPCWLCWCPVGVVCLVGCVGVLFASCLRPVCGVLLVGCCPVCILFASCLHPVCVLCASCLWCPVGWLLSCVRCFRAPCWLLVCLFWGSYFSYLDSV